MKNSQPLISCICITARRIALLQRAIKCFQMQEYHNRELIISFPQSDNLTGHVVQRFIANGNPRIVAIRRHDDLSLGLARNQALSNASGDYICIWDDDDWYHPNRLNYQISILINNRGGFNSCVLCQVILYDSTTTSAYLSFQYPWENTLLFDRSLLGEVEYLDRSKAEDSYIIDRLHRLNSLYHIPSASELYIYVYHRENTWGYSHFRSFIKRSKKQSKEYAFRISQLLSQ